MRLMFAFALAFMLLMGAALAACDPVHSNGVDALGGEAPGVRTGPLHRPGQPCLLCHDGRPGDPPEFSVAGTVFANPTDRTPAPNADVELTDSTGATVVATTNSAGNFYLTQGELTPAYPMKVVVRYQGRAAKMLSSIGRDGSCAGCHVDPAGPSSPGHVSAIDPLEAGAP